MKHVTPEEVAKLRESLALYGPPLSASQRDTLIFIVANVTSDARTRASQRGASKKRRGRRRALAEQRCPTMPPALRAEIEEGARNILREGKR